MNLFKVYTKDTFEDITKDYAITSTGELNCIGYDHMQAKGTVFFEWLGPGNIIIGDGCFKTYKKNKGFISKVA